MNDILTLLCLLFLTFCVTVSVFISGIVKKNKTLKLVSIFGFILLFYLAGFTVKKCVNKSYNKVTQRLKQRTGEEIYAAIFGKPIDNCVKIINAKDQIVPKIDVAILLQFETCPKELKRLLSKHEYIVKKGNRHELNELIHANQIDWFDTTMMGDSITVHEFSMNNGKNIQTFWVSFDSTKVFYRDVLD